MSLLNDALRKKRHELRPTGGNSALSADLSPQKRAVRRIKTGLVILGGVTVILLTPTAWKWLKPSLLSSPSAPHAQTARDDRLYRAADAHHQSLKRPYNPALQQTPLQKENPLNAAGHQKSAAAPTSVTPTANTKSPSPEAATAQTATQKKTQNSAAPRKSAVKPAGHHLQGQPLPENTVDRANGPRQTNEYEEVSPSAFLPAPQRKPSVTVSNRLTAKKLQPVTRLYRKAQQYHRQHRITDAIALYREVLKLRPHHMDAQINLASALIQRRKFSNARRLSMDTVKQAPDNHRAQLNWAIADIGLGNPAQALSRLDQAERLHPEPWFEVYLHRGVAFSHLQQHAKARQAYERARQLSPKDPQVLFNLAIINDKSEHYQKAVEYYQEYLRAHADILPEEKKRISLRLRRLKAYLASSAAHR
jgi:Flp pilus assembly protein TadD